jgi:flagellar motility protein MotE (MotC chaperone)
MGGFILESNPEIYIEKIANKKPGLQIVFQTMNLRFRYAAHSLQ